MTTGKRRSPRTYACFETLVSSGRMEGSGVLCNVSSVGALVEEATAKPGIGSRVSLNVPLDDDLSFETSGSVVRHTESGFAIEFEKAPTDLLQLLEDRALREVIRLAERQGPDLEEVISGAGGRDRRSARGS